MIGPVPGMPTGVIMLAVRVVPGRVVHAVHVVVTVLSGVRADRRLACSP